MFNIDDSRGFGPWLILSIFGTYRRLRVSRLYMKFVKDRAAFESSLKPILALDFDHVVPSHGHVVRGEGRARLAAALRERGVAV